MSVVAAGGRRRPAILLVAAMLAAPFAARADWTDEPPAPTETTEQCEAGQVFDEETKTCVAIRESRLSDAARILVARELATFGRPADALALLALHETPPDADILTLRGYATRKAGDWEGGVALYHAALALDPDHWQARSYLGQGLVQRGERRAAAEQLRLIRVAGGRGTPPERALAASLATGEVGY